MKTIARFTLILIAVSLSGCAVSGTYHRSVVVTRDAEGKIVSRVETEEVTQNNLLGPPMRFEHLNELSPSQTQAP